MTKSKTESPTTRLKTLLLKLSEYTIDLKYQKGLEMHISDALSRLQNIADTPDNKDIIPLNFLQHLTPNYIEHTYSHLVENFYVHNTKSIDTTQVKRKQSRPPKSKLENSNSNLKSTTAATICTAPLFQDLQVVQWPLHMLVQLICYTTMENILKMLFCFEDLWCSTQDSSWLA